MPWLASGLYLRFPSSVTISISPSSYVLNVLTPVSMGQRDEFGLFLAGEFSATLDDLSRLALELNAKDFPNNPVACFEYKDRFPSSY
jgi:hypothetical protein